MLVTGAGSSVTDKLTRQLRWACLAPGAPRLYALASALACFILHSCALPNQPQPESLRCEHYTSSVHHHGHQLSAKMVKVDALVLFFVAGAAAAPIVSQSPYGEFSWLALMLCSRRRNPATASAYRHKPLIFIFLAMADGWLACGSLHISSA